MLEYQSSLVPSLSCVLARSQGRKRKRSSSLALLLLMLLVGVGQTTAQNAPQPASEAEQRERVEKQLQALLAMRRDMQQALLNMQAQVSEFDTRIGALEVELTGVPPKQPASILTAAPSGGQVPKPEKSASASRVAHAPLPADSGAATESPKKTEFDLSDIANVADWDAFEQGKGLVAARGKLGELTFGINTYLRCLNQENLNPTYTDSFGRTFPFDKRQDLMVNREQLSFRGWLFDEDFRYNFFAWTENTNMGEFSQVVLAGNFLTHFSDAVNLRYGLFSLPTTRSTSQSVPNWLKFDHRTLADEYFRGSYTMAIGADGKIADGLEYRTALGNNLSTLGVSPKELDNDMNTYSMVLWWMPTTHEYGPGKGFGDYEEHKELATLIGFHYTHSREDAQGQPTEDSFENSQLRLSDGTLLFSPDPFMTGGKVERATYDMLDFDAGFKYRGWSLDCEYYFRWLSDFRTIGNIPVDQLFDHGFQVQASTMLAPQEWQAYIHYSKIFGDYGDPWEFGLGANWFPYKHKEIRINFQTLYEEAAAAGSRALPYQVGADGWIWTVDAGFSF